MIRMIAISTLMLLAPVGGAMAQGAQKGWNFQGDAVGAPPAGFLFGRTGEGRAGNWIVRLDPSAPDGDHVLMQTDDDGTNYRFPVAVAEPPAPKDLRAEVRCKPVSGRIDRACGIVFRYRDADNYYVARANALEDNVNLYRVVAGRRREIEGWSGPVASGTWHTLAVEARGDRLKVFWEGKPIIDVTDGTFPQAGRVGLWTKADSVTSFDALTVRGLP